MCGYLFLIQELAFFCPNNRNCFAKLFFILLTYPNHAVIIVVSFRRGRMKRDVTGVKEDESRLISSHRRKFVHFCVECIRKMRCPFLRRRTGFSKERICCAVRLGFVMPQPVPPLTAALLRSERHALKHTPADFLSGRVFSHILKFCCDLSHPTGCRLTPSLGWKGGGNEKKVER